MFLQGVQSTFVLTSVSPYPCVFAYLFIYLIQFNLIDGLPMLGF